VDLPSAEAVTEGWFGVFVLQLIDDVVVWSLGLVDGASLRGVDSHGVRLLPHYLDVSHLYG